MDSVRLEENNSENVIDYDVTISRAVFENLIDNFVRTFLKDTVERALVYSGVNKLSISTLVCYLLSLLYYP